MISIAARPSLVLASLTLKYPVGLYTVVRRVFIGFSLSILLFLSGCSALGPDFLKPEAKVTTDWLTDGSVFSKDKAFQEKWWETFNDPVLNSLIEQAYQQNLSLQVAGLKIMEARAQLGISKGNRYPQSQQISGATSDIGISENSPNFNPGVDDSYTNHQVGFDAAWELDFWGRFRRAIESSESSLAVTEADYDDALVILTAEVARTYVIIRTLEERLALVKSNITFQSESLRIAQIRFDNGATTELDVQQATSNLADTQALEPSLIRSLRQATNGLSVLLGMPPSDLSGILKSGHIPRASEAVTTGVPSDLLRRRPDVRLAEQFAASQSALIGVAKADLYPSFSLTGSIGYQASNTGSSEGNDIFNSESLFFSGGPSFRWNIFNYGQIKNNVRIQDARFQQSLVNYQNTVLTAYQEVEDAMVAYSQAQQETKFRAISAGAALRAVEIAKIQYREGSVDFQRVIDSERFLVSQQDQWTQARGDIALNLIAMYKALGGGWGIRKGQNIIPESMRQEMEQRTNWGDLLSEDK
jgi:NodT family efflux transporter outer membrane factor (OMF) lipoprotein